MQRTLPSFFFLLSVLSLALAPPAAGQISLPLPVVNQNWINIPISLPGGLGGNLTLNFETVTHLSLVNLGFSAQLVSPLDLGLLARLPPNVSIPLGLPILLRIEPTASGGLSFNGLLSIQMVSLTLPQTPNLRLYGAPLGGRFTDLTDIKTDTTDRVLGSKGGFSEFLVVVDSTPPAQAVTNKLGALDQLLADNAGAIAPPVAAELATELAAIHSRVAAGQLNAAVQEIDAFEASVVRHSGPEIPDVWSAAHDRVNVAGLLRAGVRTLRFSLKLLPGS